MIKTGDEVTINGEVEFQFYDPYDWTGGDTVPIGFSWGQAIVFPLIGAPFEGWPDSNMILLQEFRGAKEFVMTGGWKKKVEGTITVGFWSNDINLEWSDL